MSASDWPCDQSIYSNSLTINNALRPSDDPLRPWKYAKVPTGSTVGQILSAFDSRAKHQFLKDVQTAAGKVGFKPQERLVVYESILKSTPIFTTLGLITETSLNRTFRPDATQPVSTDIVIVARSGTSSKHRFTKRGELATSTKWHTRCSSCGQEFKTGQRVVEMENGDWSHYWQYPVYGYSFKEILDVYRDKAEDGSMPEGVVIWMDLTRTRFWVGTDEAEAGVGVIETA